jgi:hypothetical protein
MAIFRKIRQKDLKKVLWVLVIVIVPAFMLWGANWFVKERRDVAGIMYGRRISTDEYQSFIRNTQVLFLLGFGREFLEQMQPEQLNNYVWQSLLFIEKAKKEGLEVSNEELAQRIRNLAFLNSQGSFSKERYLAILDNLRVVPGQFEEFLKNMIKADKLKQMVLIDVDVTDEEARQIYAMENEEAKIKYVFIDFEKRKNEIQPQREELEEFFNKDKEAFRIPAKVKIAYILIKEDRSEILKDVQSEIAKTAALEQIAERFDMAVTESGFFSQDDAIEGLGWQDEIVHNAFLLEKGQVAGPFTTTEGVVFFKKIDYKESYLPQFSQVADEVKEELVSSKAIDIANDFAGKIISTIKEQGIDDLDKLKSTFSNIEVAQSEFFKRQDYLEKIGLEAEFNQRVFALQKGQILQEALKLQKGFCIVQLLEKKDIDEEKFSEENEDYKKKIFQHKQILRLNAYLAELVQESQLQISRLQSRTP